MRNEAEYDDANAADLDAAVRRLSPDTTIQYECFNRREADWAEMYMLRKHPAVPFRTTRLF